MSTTNTRENGEWRIENGELKMSTTNTHKGPMISNKRVRKGGLFSLLMVFCTTLKQLITHHSSFITHRSSLFLKAFLLACAFSILHPPFSIAQTYPIYVTPSLTPPYSLKLSDYCRLGSQQLVVNITVNDLKISNLPVKLRIRMESVGVTIENPLTITTTPIYLDGGQVSILYGDDLTDYFNIDNLIFKGYSRETYRRTGQLPDGYWKISVEVVHFGTGKVISNAGTTSAWMATGKPPQLKIPEDGADMGQYQGMPLVFSWLPSNTGIPMAAGNIQYTFELWEMRVNGIDPYVVAASIPVFHSEQQQGTVLSFMPAAHMMEPGMRYAWRVTAFDPAGQIPFEQDGHSQIRTFTYQRKCDSVSNFTALVRARQGTFQWQPGANHTGFNVETRNPATGWQSASQTFDNKVTYNELDYGSTYQLRVQAVCNGNPQSVSDFTGWRTVNIPERKPIDTEACPTCRCDDTPVSNALSNLTLRNDLQPGDIITHPSGTTRFIIKSVTPQGDGIYKGVFLFWAEIWNLKFICEYWDLSVNTDNIIVKMDYESIYDPLFLADAEATKEYLENLGGAVAELTTNTNIKDTIKINRPIDGIYVNAGDSIVIVTVNPDGSLTETVLDDQGFNRTLVQGENGEEYVITKDGKVMGVDEFKHTGGNNLKMEEYRKEKEAAAEPNVRFAASPQQRYGFDSYTEQKTVLQSEYPELKPGYRPAFKSMASHATDRVKTSSHMPGVTFRDEMGLPAIKAGEELSLRGSSGGSQTAWYAYRAMNDTTEKIVGKLNVLSFDEQVKKVYLVPVNGAKTPDASTLRNTLSHIYAQAVTGWEVSTLPGISVSFAAGNMTHGGSNAVSVYNADQKAIIKSFGKMEKEALYLFFIDHVTAKSGDIAGYMPLQRQAGFIYDNPNATLIAHELGHGAFNLRHTFSPDRLIAAEATTENLMDYKGGTELWKHQWKKVQDPESVWMAWAEDEEEGEAKIIKNAPLTVFRILETIRYLHASGQTITLEERAARYYADNITLNDGKTYNKIVIDVNLSGKFVIDSKNINKYLTVKIIDEDNQRENFKTYMLANIPLSEMNKVWSNQINYMLSDASKKEEVALRLNVIPKEVFSLIAMNQRSSMLSFILNQDIIRESQYIKDNDVLIELKQENVLLNLITSIDDSEIGELFKRLQKNHLMQLLCYSIDNWGGEDNYTKFIGILANYFYKIKKNELIEAGQNSDRYQNVLWQKKNDTNRGTGNIRYSKNYVNNKLMLELQYGTILDNDRKYPLPEIDPFDIIILNIGTVPIHFCKDCLIEGDQLAMPAFLFEWILNEYNNQQIMKYIDVGITIVSFVRAAKAVIKIPKTINNIILAINSINAVDLFRSTKTILEEYLPEAVDGWKALTIISDLEAPVSDIIATNYINRVGSFIALWDIFKTTKKYEELTISNPEIIVEINRLIEIMIEE